MLGLKLSFTGLLQSLINQAPKPKIDLDEAKSKTQKITTTVRLEEPVKLYFDGQAQNLGISLPAP